MPRLQEATLSGNRRNSPFRKRSKRVDLRATIVWDGPRDHNRNGTLMLIQFFGDDGSGTRGDDNLQSNVHSIVKGSGAASLDGPLGYRMRYSQDGDVTSVWISYENRADRGGIGGRRRFNEDVAARDEIFAKVVLFDYRDPLPPEGGPGELITNRLTGRW